MNNEIMMKYVSMEVWFLITIIFFSTTLIMISIKAYYFVIILLGATITAGKIAFDRRKELENEC